MPGDARFPGSQPNERRANVHGFDGADAQAAKRSLTEDALDEIEEGQPRSKVVAIPAEVDSGQDDFRISCFVQSADFLKHLARRQAAAGSANRGNNAKRALGAAAVLHL